MPEPSQVLIVDDHPHMVALIKRWLVRAGYHVTGVTTVQEALEALTTHAPRMGDYRPHAADRRWHGYPLICAHP